MHKSMTFRSPSAKQRSSRGWSLFGSKSNKYQVNSSRCVNSSEVSEVSFIHDNDKDDNNDNQKQQVIQHNTRGSATQSDLDVARILSQIPPHTTTSTSTSTTTTTTMTGTTTTEPTATCTSQSTSSSMLKNTDTSEQREQVEQKRPMTYNERIRKEIQKEMNKHNDGTTSWSSSNLNRSKDLSFLMQPLMDNELDKSGTCTVTVLRYIL